MKLIAIGLVLTTGVALIATTPAQAAAKADPVKALKAQYITGKGVKIATLTRVSIASDFSGTVKVTGVVQFGGRGPVASDMTSKSQYDMDSFKGLDAEEYALFESLQLPIRTITVKRTSYVADARVADNLPIGKIWVRSPAWTVPTSEGTLIDIFEPGKLKSIIAGATSFRGGVLKGSIKPTKYERGGKVGYVLWFDAKGLVKRMTTTTTVTTNDNLRLTASSDTRFTAWASEVSVSAPPAYQVIDEKDVDDDIFNERLDPLSAVRQ